MNHQDLNDDELVEIILINREFQSLSQLDHPCIAELLEVFRDQNYIYFVSPFYTGGNIEDLIIP